MGWRCCTAFRRTLREGVGQGRMPYGSSTVDHTPIYSKCAVVVCIRAVPQLLQSRQHDWNANTRHCNGPHKSLDSAGCSSVRGDEHTAFLHSPNTHTHTRTHTHAHTHTHKHTPPALTYLTSFLRVISSSSLSAKVNSYSPKPRSVLISMFISCSCLLSTLLRCSSKASSPSPLSAHHCWTNADAWLS